MDKELLEKFKNREIKAKEIFEIKEIDKNTAYEFVRQYHYLADKKFFSMHAYGLFTRMGELVGCATYSLLQGICALKGWFGLDYDDDSVLELSRLCMLPELNGCNATSYLLGNSMKLLNKQYGTRAITTLADGSRHFGSIYQVCNFKYYGTTTTAMDFFTIDHNGKMIINRKGKVSELKGVYVKRTTKHRYAYIFDKKLKCLYQEQPHPTQSTNLIPRDCCNGTNIVYDERFNSYYTCPVCTGKLVEMINIDGNWEIKYKETNPLKRALLKKQGALI